MIRLLLPLLAGFGIDCLLGDPHSLPHPVVLIGKTISALERVLRKMFPKTPRGERAAGAVLWGICLLYTSSVRSAAAAPQNELTPGQTSKAMPRFASSSNSVSYTHLDVYKRQGQSSAPQQAYGARSRSLSAARQLHTRKTWAQASSHASGAQPRSKYRSVRTLSLIHI